MDQTAALLEAFGMLDIVLAVFGALIFALWRGRGKSLSGLLAGAAMGGLARPAVLLLFGSGLLIAAGGGGSDIRQTPEEQQKTIDFWTK